MVHLINVLNIANRGRNAFFGTTTMAQNNAALSSLKVSVTISRSFISIRSNAVLF